MSFYQNPFTADFRGNLVLGDRQFILTFQVLGNKGRGDQDVVAWKVGPYNLTGNDTDGNLKKNLTISYALDPNNFSNWATFSVDITSTAASATAVQPFEIVSALQANTNFQNLFGASLYTWAGKNNAQMVKIHQTQPYTRLHFYIVTGGAEETLQFNARSGVAELPTYFDRHTISNKLIFADSVGMLLYLDPTIVTRQAVIDNAQDYLGHSLGYSHLTIQADWQLLKGRSGLFQFTKVSGGTSIIYSAGSQVGDLALMIVIDGANKFEMPYTLTAGDLITPP